jgi:hypothetical protein
MHLARRLRPLIAKPFIAHMFYIRVCGRRFINGYSVADTRVYALRIIEQDATGYDQADFQGGVPVFMPQIPSRRTVST